MILENIKIDSRARNYLDYVIKVRLKNQKLPDYLSVRNGKVFNELLH